MIKKILPTLPKLYDAGGNTSQKWFVWHYVNAKRVKVYRLKSDESKGINSLKTASARYEYAERIIAELCNTAAHTTVVQDGTKDIAGILLNAIDSQKSIWRAKTVFQYSTQIGMLRRFCAEKRLKVINKRNADDFMQWLKDSRQCAPRTVNSYRGNLARIWRIAANKGELPAENPFVGLLRLKENSQGCRAFSMAHRRELKKHISTDNPMLWLCCQFLYYCFIRPGELRLLKTGDIDLSEGKILLRGIISKNKKTQFVTIPLPFLDCLQQYGIQDMPTNLFVIGTNNVGNEKAVSSTWIGRHHRKILARLGYETGRHGYNFYSWKHTGVIAAVKAGINLRELQLQLRHHSLEEMQHYLHALGINDCDQVRLNFPEL